jgi:hypothetical protein
MPSITVDLPDWDVAGDCHRMAQAVGDAVVVAISRGDSRAVVYADDIRAQPLPVFPMPPEEAYRERSAIPHAIHQQLLSSRELHSAGDLVAARSVLNAALGDGADGSSTPLARAIILRRLAELAAHQGDRAAATAYTMDEVAILGELLADRLTPKSVIALATDIRLRRAAMEMTDGPNVREVDLKHLVAQIDRLMAGLDEGIGGRYRYRVSVDLAHALLRAHALITTDGGDDTADQLGRRAINLLSGIEWISVYWADPDGWETAAQVRRRFAASPDLPPAAEPCDIAEQALLRVADAIGRLADRDDNDLLRPCPSRIAQTVARYRALCAVRDIGGTPCAS